MSERESPKPEQLRARAKAIFVEAVELPLAERSAFIERAAGGDGAVRAEVASLLAAIEEAGEGFDAPPASGPIRDELIGSMVGPYKILEQIGEGGFGSVYMAQQSEPVVRRVALKIIKLGMDTRQVIARFEAERQALAMMDHPNIAKVLDAGATASGRPYFAMELVKGVPITEYCDAGGLATRERLDLFLAVCRAIQHAHQKGIIHRDIKPSNVLVTVADGRPLPKVIDFGIAKATGGRLTDKTLFTEFRQLLGTPEYMSPEQAQTHGVDVDTRTDIYSLGVLLYELLTGTTPFDPKRLRSAEFDELKRIIKEEEPQKPSTRVSRQKSTTGRTTTAEAARARGTDLGGLAKLLRGELDWIIMKAMDKDRSRRYETVNSLAVDIERFLRNEPVLAGPPGAAYRLRKWTRRNRVAVSAGSAVFLALVGGLGLAMFGLFRAMKERDEREQARTAEAREHVRAEQKAAEAFRESYKASLAAAAASLELGDGAAMRRHLSGAPQDLRGWEWKLLDHLADRSIRTAKLIDGDFKVSGLFGEYVVTENAYKTRLVRWTDAFRAEMDAGKLDGTESIAMSPTGDRLLVSRYLGTMLYELPSGRVVKQWDDDRRFQQQPFLPDGKSFVLMRGPTNEVEVLSSADASQVRSFAKPPRAGRSFAAVSPSGKLLAVETGDSETGLFDLASGAIKWTTRGVFPRFSPDGTRLLTFEGPASGAGSLSVVEVATGTRIGSTQLHGTTIAESGSRSNVVAISPDSSTLAIQTDAGEIRLLDLETLESLGTLVGLEQLGTGVGFSSDGRYLAGLSSSGVMKVWSAATRASPYRVRTDPPVPPAAIAIDRAGKWVAQGDWGRIMVRDATTGEQEWTSFPSLEAWQVATFAPDGATLVMVGERGTVLRIETRTGRVLASATPIGFKPFGAGATRAVAWSSDGSRIAVAFTEGVLAVLAADDLRVVGQLRVGEKPMAICWAGPDRLAVARGGEVTLWDLAGVAHGTATVAGARSLDVADGVLAVGGEDAIVLFDAGTLAERMRLRVPSPAESVAVRPDLRRLASGHPNGTATIWSMDSGDDVASLVVGQATRVPCLRFVGEDLVASTSRHALVRFEVGRPDAELLARREEFRLAMNLISRLKSADVSADELADRIGRDQKLPAHLRERAAQLVRTIGDHASTLNNSAALALARPMSARTLEAVLRDSKLAVERTDDPYALSVRGQVLCKAGRFEEALGMLERADRGFIATRPGWNTMSPAIVPYRVLSLAGLGRREEAAAQLRAFEASLGAASDPAIAELVGECRRAVDVAK